MRYIGFQRPPHAPTVMLQTDRDYADPERFPQLLTGQRATFNFNVVDLRTVPAKRQFRWQLFQGKRGDRELAAGWQPPGTASRLEHSFTRPGAWTLAVQFIDRDLNYSPAARVVVHVALPWHANRALMIPAGGVIAGLLGWALVARALYGIVRQLMLTLPRGNFGGARGGPREHPRLMGL